MKNIKLRVASATVLPNSARMCRTFRKKRICQKLRSRNFRRTSARFPALLETFVWGFACFAVLIFSKLSKSKKKQSTAFPLYLGGVLSVVLRHISVFWFDVGFVCVHRSSAYECMRWSCTMPHSPFTNKNERTHAKRQCHKIPQRSGASWAQHFSRLPRKVLGSGSSPTYT